MDNIEINSLIRQSERLNILVDVILNELQYSEYRDSKLEFNDEQSIIAVLFAVAPDEMTQRALDIFGQHDAEMAAKQEASDETV